jgi:hypothetical protein
LIDILVWLLFGLGFELGSVGFGWWGGLDCVWFDFGLSIAHSRGSLL